MSKNQNEYVAVAVIADIMEGKLSDRDLFLKYNTGFQTIAKLRALLKTYENTEH